MFPSKFVDPSFSTLVYSPRAGTGMPIPNSNAWQYDLKPVARLNAGEYFALSTITGWSSLILLSSVAMSTSPPASSLKLQGTHPAFGGVATFVACCNHGILITKESRQIMTGSLPKSCRRTLELKEILSGASEGRFLKNASNEQ
jgi:hypothetical protein